MTDKIFGFDWSDIQVMQQKAYVRAKVDTNAPGDYGADPVGGGMFRMVPSGDIVDFAERCKRLERKR